MAKKAARKSPSLKKKNDGGEGKAAQHFADAVITRNEAVEKKSAAKKLPPGVTHVITGTDEKGNPQVKRARFSLA